MVTVAVEDTADTVAVTAVSVRLKPRLNRRPKPKLTTVTATTRMLTPSPLTVTATLFPAMATPASTLLASERPSQLTVTAAVDTAVAVDTADTVEEA